MDYGVQHGGLVQKLPLLEYELKIINSLIKDYFTKGNSYKA